MNSLSRKEKAEFEREKREQVANEKAEAGRKKRAELARRRRQREKYSRECFDREMAEARGETYVSKETRGRKRKDTTTSEAVSSSCSKLQRTSDEQEPAANPQTLVQQLQSCIHGANLSDCDADHTEEPLVASTTNNSSSLKVEAGSIADDL